MALAVGGQDADCAKQLATVTHSIARYKTPSTILERYHHYCRQLAVLLLQHGYDHLQLSLSIIRSINAACLRWLRDHPNVSRQLGQLLNLLWKSLQQVQRLVRHSARPLVQLLSQLISIQIRISTNDDFDEQTKLSARMNSAISLVYGAIRFRSHSCVQVCSPSRQPQLHPEISVTSPCASPYPGSSPRRSPHSSKYAAFDIALQQQQQQQQQQHSLACSSQLSPKKGRKLQQHQQNNCRNVQQSVAADSEVHLLCSSELRSAILAFLQHHSTTNGQDFVLLSSSNRDSPCSAAVSASTAQRSTDVHRGVQCMLDPAADCWHEAAPDTGGNCSEAAAVRSADPAGFPSATGVGVSPGSPGYVNHSRHVFQCMARKSNRSSSSQRVVRSLSAFPAAALRSSYSAGDDSQKQQVEDFSFAASKWHYTAAATAVCGHTDQRRSWSGGHCNNENDVDGVIAVCVDEERGISHRVTNCAFTAATSNSAAGSGSGRKRFEGNVLSAAASSSLSLLDPQLAPLMSFMRKRSSGNESGSNSSNSTRGPTHCVDRQQQYQHYLPDPLPAAGHYQAQQYPCSLQCRPARSPSPIATPARHGVRGSTGSSKKITHQPPPVVIGSN